ncbi:MAG: insulinase family protein [Gemmatimonadetes bacterium]|nr:insulinase family protein [Gemmatimonadota bacterium]
MMQAGGAGKAGRAGAAERWWPRALTALGVMLPGLAVAQYPTSPPAAGPLRPFQLPALQETTLANGLKLLVIEDHREPMVGISLSLPAGSRRDPVGREGTASLLAGLLTKGTATRSAQQLTEQLEQTGSTFAADADMDFLTLSSGGLSEYAGALLELLGDVVQHPTFPASEFESAKTRFLSSLERERSDTRALADRLFIHAVYGDHPYGRRASVASVQSITRDDLAAFAATSLKPGGTLLVVAGDISAAQARSLAQRAFGSWKGNIPAGPSAAPAAAAPTRFLLVNRPGAVQSSIVLGHLTISPADPRQYGLIVGNRILGEGNDSRLFRSLAQEKRLAAEAHSEIGRRRDVAHFLVATQARQQSTEQALSELGDQVARLRTEMVSDSELTRSKGYLIGSFPRQMETVQQIASQVTAIRQLGLGDDYLRNFRERVSAVTAEGVRAAAQAATHPDSAIVVVVGDGPKIYEQIKTMGPVDIVDVEGKPLEVADLAPKAGPLNVDRAQLVSRRDSFIVIVNGNPLGTYISETVAGGDSLTYRETLSIPVARWNLDTRARLSLSDLEMRSLDQTGSMASQQAETHLVFAGGRVKGRAQIPQPGGTPKVGTLDTIVAPGTIDQGVISAIVPGLPLEPQTSYTVFAFDAADGSVKPVQVTVTAVGNLGVPAGIFPVFQVQVMGPQPVILYITRDTPRRIVKVERMGQPMSFELVK